MNSLIPQVDVPCGEKGIYRIERKEVKPRFQSFRFGRYVPDGEYTFLYRGDTLVMSDTPDERQDHYAPVRKATGRCLIVGLGLGVVLNAIAKKPEVTHIDVVEVSQDVIDLVAAHYLKLYPDKINIHCASIFDWVPPSKEKYDIAWFDIWDNLCTDNLEEMKILHRKFGKRAVWKGSWGRELLTRMQRQGW